MLNHLNKFINKLFYLKKIKYHYFQGFHDFTLYTLILFYQTQNVGLVLLQRVMELHLKNILNDVESTKNLFNDYISNIKEIIESIDFPTSEFIKLNCPELFSLIIKWVLCLFTHEIFNLHMAYRVLDYLLCSKPSAILYLTAHVWYLFYKIFLDNN